ncbi:YheC/YheD family protein [Gorillibacterium timonense]|uniref:YheC/YheD family protein n=1 Tax=Gorillibacterium timonense TaxID=1689269 RepID=UPI00071CDA83|nr:YheC/YheD family protein [Gorillibacterium timonense]
MPRYVASKWRKTAALRENERIRPFLLPMERMTPSTLDSMLVRHRTVFVKPVSGMHGKGVIKVELVKSAEKPYRYQEGLVKRSFKDRGSLYKAILKVAAGRPYLVQKGIRLLRYKDRPFDIRVMIQQSPAKRWEVTGIICRVAQPGKIVTNVHNGGRLQPIERMLKPYAHKRSMERSIADLKSLGKDVAEHLGRRFPGIKEIGLDIGIDGDLKPWIIETNTSPASFIFKHLPDKSIYQRVRNYAIAYGKLRRPKPAEKKPVHQQKKPSSARRAAAGKR